ncbi:MAG TPA: hypothetical protein VL092_06180 [Chitinophagaceae bacterium]|nr:hypothetical protein [Chitinophagaceae bacterium]
MKRILFAAALLFAGASAEAQTTEVRWYNTSGLTLNGALRGSMGSITSCDPQAHTGRYSIPPVSTSLFPGTVTWLTPAGTNFNEMNIELWSGGVPVDGFAYSLCDDMSQEIEVTLAGTTFHFDYTYTPTYIEIHFKP